MKRTNAEHPMPDSISYVSDVDQHIFTVTTFTTNSLDIINETHHDDRIEIFNFLLQTFMPVTESSTEPRVGPHPTNETQFQIRGDDGWLDVDCPFGNKFNETNNKCEPISFCEGKSSGNYGLTEQMIDSLVLNHTVIRREDNTQNADIHPTMYLRCFENGTHSVQECPPNNLFDRSSNTCVMRNDCETRPDNYVLSNFPEELLINEYMVCQNGEPKIVSCPSNQIFDRRLLTCVDAHPCALQGEGFTYITDSIGEQQYFRCTSTNNAELVTCILRVYQDEKYQCAGDSICTQFENGTGTLLNSYQDDNVQFDTGILVCDNYEILDNIQCDSTNILENKIFNSKFIVALHLPKEIYDSVSRNCIDFKENLITTTSPYFAVQSLPNHLNVEFETAMIGDIERLDVLLSDENKLNDAMLYARNNNSIGLNLNGDDIDCLGDHLYDIFYAVQLNNCENNVLIKAVVLKNNEYIKSFNNSVGEDFDYNSACVANLNAQQSNFVEMDHFNTRILTDILRNDVCGIILEQIHSSYTTIASKYTTIDGPYNYEIVKTPFYMTKNTANTYDIPITINANDTVNDTIVDDNVVKPLFDPFEHIKSIEPLFNPFLENEIKMNVDDDDDNGDVDKDDDEDIETNAPPPELELTQKVVEYSCFYSLPTFKYSSCNIDNDHIKTMLASLRENVNTHPDCVNAIGLANVINSYAYLGQGVGCQSKYDSELGKIVIDKVENGPVYLNVDTQSNDNVKYNNWIHQKNNMFIACPQDNLINNDETLKCNIDDNKIYYIEDLQYN
jgi:Viral capsid protein 91 N-terminal/Chitin binding Peritrophin-A domain